MVALGHCKRSGKSRLLFAMSLLVLLISSLRVAEAKSLRSLGQRNDDVFSNSPALETCEDLIVQVTSIQTVCDSPQTFYYGSGVNRNSRTCNYGDKATITVYFDVTEDLYDTNIYVVMSVYAGYGDEVLTSTSPTNLKKYVGYTCNEAGSYSYTYSTTIGSANSGSYGYFVPYIQIAFSSAQNGDYNLGAANIPCQWDDRQFGEWTEVAAKSSQITSRDFLVEYGILLATVVTVLGFVAAFSTVTVYRSRRMKAEQSKKLSDEKSAALMAPPQETLSA